MENGSAAALTAANANDFQDLSIIPQIFKSDERNVLIWDGFKPDGQKNQSVRQFLKYPAPCNPSSK